MGLSSKVTTVGEAAAVQSSEAIGETMLSIGETMWGAQRQDTLKGIVADHGELGNFYEVLGLPVFAEATADELDAAYWSSSNAASASSCGSTPSASSSSGDQARGGLLALARHVLQHPDLKRRYDLELRRAEAEGCGGEQQGWSCYKVGSVVILVSGITVLVVGMSPVGMGMGMAFVLSMAGSAIMSAGINGLALSTLIDPDCTVTEYVKSLIVGALQGMAGCASCAFIGLAPLSAPFLMQYFQAVAVGAALQGSGMAISDLSDLLCTGGFLGQHVKDNVVSAKTADWILTWAYARHFAASSFMGPLFAHLVPAPAKESDGAEDDTDSLLDPCVCGTCPKPGRGMCWSVCLETSRAGRRAVPPPTRSVEMASALLLSRRTRPAEMAGALLVSRGKAPADAMAAWAGTPWAYAGYATHFTDLVSAGATVLSEFLQEEVAAKQQPTSAQWESCPPRPSTPESSPNVRPTLFKQPKVQRSVRSFVRLAALGGA